jgi:hypothetical protein
VRIKFFFLMLGLLTAANSCIKVNYRIMEIGRGGGAITLHHNEAAELSYTVRGEWLKASDPITMTAENLPAGMTFKVKSINFNTSDDEFEIAVVLGAGSAKGGHYTVRMVASSEDGGRTERFLDITISPYTIADLMNMKRAYDTLYDANGGVDRVLEYQTFVYEDFTNKPIGVGFSDLGIVMDMQSSTFPDTYAQLDTISGKVTLFENDQGTRLLKSGEGYILDNGYTQYVVINYVSTNTTNNTSRNGKVTLRKN